MRKIFLCAAALVCLTAVIPAFGQERSTWGPGAPSAQSPVPDCNQFKQYRDSNSGNLWVSKGSPCSWVNPGSNVYPGMNSDGNNGVTVSGNAQACTFNNWDDNVACYPGSTWDAQLQNCINAHANATLFPYVGVCDATALTGSQTMAADVSLSTAGLMVLMGPMTLSMGTHRLVVPAGTKNVYMKGWTRDGATTNQVGVTTLSYTGIGAPVVVGTTGTDTLGFYLGHVTIDITGAGTSAIAEQFNQTQQYKQEDVTTRCNVSPTGYNQIGFDMEGGTNQTSGKNIDLWVTGCQTTLYFGQNANFNVFQDVRLNGTWSGVYINSWSITSNVATFQYSGPITITQGMQLTLQGFFFGSYFNNQVVTVLSTGLSSSQFEANFTHANASAASEFGASAGNGATPVSMNFAGTSTATASNNQIHGGYSQGFQTAVTGNYAQANYIGDGWYQENTALYGASWDPVNSTANVINTSNAAWPYIKMNDSGGHNSICWPGGCEYGPNLGFINVLPTLAWNYNNCGIIATGTCPGFGMSSEGIYASLSGTIQFGMDFAQKRFNFGPGGVQAVGTQTISGCSLSTAAGGATAGKFLSGTTGTCTVTITPGYSAPTGFKCSGTDITTGAALSQSAFSTTTCALSGTTTSGDSVVWAVESAF